MAPIWIPGHVPRSSSAPPRGAGVPPAITRAAPTTGSRAADPGHGVDVVTVTAARPMPTSPIQVMTAATLDGSRRSCGARTATSPPRASSQARVSGE